MPELPDRIISFLKSNNISFDVLNHEPVRTSLEAASVRPGLAVENGAKAMILKKKKTENAEWKDLFFMVVLPGDLKVDYKKVKLSLNVSDVQLASPEEVLEIAEVEVGAVPPFGNLMGLPVLLDSRLLEKSLVAFNAGSHAISIILKPADLLKAFSPRVGDFSKI